MILLIDNYDSFTFNIYDYLCRLDATVQVIKNDEMTIEQIKQLPFAKIIISPGPGTPSNAGVSLTVIAEFAHYCPILGICLGHQAIAQYYGYSICKAPLPMHGKIDEITHDGQGLFKGIKNPLSIVRYHSLIVNDNLSHTNSPLIVTARNKQGLIMGLRHKTLPIESVQFHPEAIKTESGLQMIHNFIYE
ncbi:aminodeoxychorismate/anthranilate synthase component II [Gilliamella sp. B2776]|uniref:anthranilate synthase component II n=1 Tax=unclassified Gilliamella TaxID=2685620 RepID=UPI002269B857|nr:MULTISPECIES: aminodeoxychorismate/anthranilate synthase component II [unclassified Gilliamella]MCX8648936.1 aminodeoxychorismate/anthranilate synthase component II [Gilliamella sp. B2779]MCX8653188.1 aminodeoxychorismate/anthranilate synthase component II [Gilliamella sp. B2737]MCX8655448.1 aminodeoxychorismate/anthranilate synthase component II [Gilliamella sp. B2894]MCX8664213.1 aminodeoxychorismate/anthranilate synthase component II [Gilliamella sp. B2887]MCX8690748.1 aminodeoxychorisma